MYNTLRRWLLLLLFACYASLDIYSFDYFLLSTKKEYFYEKCTLWIQYLYKNILLSNSSDISKYILLITFSFFYF